MTASSPSSTSTAPSSAEYIIHTADLPPSALKHHVHKVQPSCHHYQYNLGDTAGFTKIGVYLNRLPAGTACTPVHWHTDDDEWMYILDAGEGGAVLVWEPSPEAAEDGSAKGVLKEVAVKNGDFLAFKAGVERAHTLRAGTSEMLYLVGGSRWERDVCRYPLEGKKLLIECPPGGSRKETLEDEEIGAPRQ